MEDFWVHSSVLDFTEQGTLVMLFILLPLKGGVAQLKGEESG
jgi:hypothetical protein